jgi:hypothetical protein
MIAVITVHGIGSQEAPSGLATSDGYADALHEGLRKHLGPGLGDDPNRAAAGGRGPVYAQSNYPPLSHATMALHDLEALRQHPANSAAPAANLQPRSDPPAHRGLMARLLHLHNDAAAAAPPPGGVEPGAFGVMRTVEDDVAAYVTRNEHRERVRMFLRDAASRLIGRADVDGVIVNGHSNGTVMGFDLIAALSPPSARSVRALITSGSPLRKYSDLLDWGRDAGNLRLMSGRWTNFWDTLDPVADPLAPPSGWKRGQPMPEGGGPGMFVVHDPDTGAESPMAVTDIQVDNVKDSTGGGLRAHNYWDNDAFCSAAAELITASRSRA